MTSLSLTFECYFPENIFDCYISLYFKLVYMP